MKERAVTEPKAIKKVKKVGKERMKNHTNLRDY